MVLSFFCIIRALLNKTRWVKPYSTEVTMTREQNQPNNECLPIAKNEDVEFSEALADEDDLEAMKRAEEADRRQEGSC